MEFDDAYFGGPTAGGKRSRGTEKAKVLVAFKNLRILSQNAGFRLEPKVCALKVGKTSGLKALANFFQNF